MMAHIPLRVLLIAFVVCVPSRVLASPIVIDFENLNDGDAVTTQYPGLTFSNATVITAGISLNEIEFPPHSGTNVAFDDGGPIRIDFMQPIVGVGGYFTYSVPLLFEAFDATGALLGSATSLFSSNLVLSGDPGSHPNEFLALAPGNISYITITGDSAGGSFVVDDLQPVAEPGTLSLFVAGVAVVAARWRRRLPSHASGVSGARVR